MAPTERGPTEFTSASAGVPESIPCAAGDGDGLGKNPSSVPTELR
jgi:hypothetical protein